MSILVGSGEVTTSDRRERSRRFFDGESFRVGTLPYVSVGSGDVKYLVKKGNARRFRLPSR